MCQSVRADVALRPMSVQNYISRLPPFLVASTDVLLISAYEIAFPSISDLGLARCKCKSAVHGNEEDWDLMYRLTPLH